MRSQTAIVVFLCALAGAVLDASGAWAVTPPPGADFGFAPVSQTNELSPRTTFNYEVPAGSQFLDSAKIYNFSSAPETFLIYSSDAFNVAAGGQFALRQRGYPNREVGVWVTPEAGQVTVPSLTAVTIPFNVVVPHTATPGDHVGGVVALNVTPQPQASGRVTFQIHRGIGIAIFLRVRGPVLPGLAVTDVGAHFSEPWLAFVKSNSRAVVHFTVQNTGNVALNVKANVKVDDIFGRTVKVFPPISLKELLPGSRAAVLEPGWHPLPIAGPEHIEVTAAAQSLNKAGSGTFWIIPWLIVVIIGLLLFGFVYWWRRRNRQKRHRQPTRPPEQVGAQDQAMAATGSAHKS